MASPLAHVPGLAGYLQQQQMAQQQESGQLQQFSQVQGLRNALAQQEMTRRALELKEQEARRAAGAGQAIGAGGLRLPDGTVIPPAARPEQPKQPPQVVQLMQIRDSLPEGHPNRATLDEAIKKLSTHQAPVNVYSGSLVAGVDDQGKPVFVQPSGRPGVDPRVVPGVRPPPNATAAREEAAARDQDTTLESVRARIASMTQKLQGNTGMVGPAGIVRRMGETVGGIAAPGMPTPALDYQNEMRLLLADVRKIVEKDPNLSNQERQNMYEMLGGGTFQTPGSAFRTLNNVLGYMENKKMSGPGRQAQIENVVKAAGWTYEPSKFDYRVIDGKVQRKAKGQ